jgi:hypothetical protein
MQKQPPPTTKGPVHKDVLAQDAYVPPKVAPKPPKK